MAARCLSLAALAVLLPPAALAQRTTAPRDTLAARDSLRRYETAPVVVTATREARLLADVPVPTTVVTREAIRQQGALRLSDLLSEQAGLVVTNALGGAGVQVQGFAPDYTLVLIDGEPVIGRTAGTLDLSRFAVAGVERVEVVRGPSSSRYGSEALAGVVNLVTAAPAEGVRGEASVRAESFGTVDLAAEAEMGRERWGTRARVGRLASSGFDLTPETPGTSAPAFTEYTAEARTRVDLAPRMRLGVSLRGQHETQRAELLLDDAAYRQEGTRSDLTGTLTLRHRTSRSWVMDASLHAARFVNDDRTVSDAGALFDSTSFAQRYAKLEGSLGYVRNAAYAAYAGAGYVHEAVGGDRYSQDKTAGQAFVFAEMQWMPSARWDVNVSARFDAPTDYAAQLSPKVAVLYKPSDRWRVRASLGSGYKAPAFRQRYLSFTNAAAGGYSVFGASEVRERVAALDAAGGLAQVLLPVDDLGELRAESSLAGTVGVEGRVRPGLVVRADAFRHHVRDLIETQAVAIKTNGQSVFSYFNVARIVSTGVEAGAEWQALPSVRLGAGYQFLRTYDVALVDQIEAGTLYWRDEAGRDRRVTRGDYRGLIGRSPHSGTLRLNWTVPRLDGAVASLRAVWRGPYGFADVDGNRIPLGAREVAPGVVLLNATLSHQGRRVGVLGGVRNLLDRTDAARLPGQPGRAVFAQVAYRL